MPGEFYSILMQLINSVDIFLFKWPYKYLPVEHLKSLDPWYTSYLRSLRAVGEMSTP